MRLAVLLGALVAASVGPAADWLDAESGLRYFYETDGSGLTLTEVSIDDPAAFAGLVEIPERIAVDGEELPVTALGEMSVSNREFREIHVPSGVTYIESFAFGKSYNATNIVFACNKPTLVAGWTSMFNPAICVFSIRPSAKNWGTVPGVLADPMYVDGELVSNPEFQLVSTALNPDYVVSISPAGGVFRDKGSLDVTLTQQAVTLDAWTKVEIRYTTDGSDPTEESRLYQPGQPLVIDSTQTVKAYMTVSQTDKLGEYALLGFGPVAEATYVFPCPNGGPYEETVDGTAWRFVVRDGGAVIVRQSHADPAVPVETEGELTLPAELGLRPVTGVDVAAFERCRYLTKVTFPATVASIASFAFKDCLRLTEVVYAGVKPTIDLAAFDGCPLAVEPGPVVTVKVALPIEIQADPDDGTLDIPENWLDLMAARFGGETWKTRFADRFGDGSTNTLTVATGKSDASGNPLQVWQEYVAGTDPLDPESALLASVEMTEEGPVIAWTPDLTAEGRIYTVYGMKNLTDRQKAVDVTALTPAEKKAAGYRFFFLTVRLAKQTEGT